MVRLLATVVLGALALVVLVPRLLPGAIMSFRIARTRRDRRGRDYDLSAAAGLHAAMPIADRANALDDRTWEDLNLDEVLRALDHTESEPGRQYLYRLLRNPHNRREPLERLERAVDRIARDAPLGDRVRAALQPLDDPRAAELVSLAVRDAPPPAVVLVALPASQRNVGHVPRGNRRVAPRVHGLARRLRA